MTDFTLTITSPRRLAAATGAREIYNDWGEGTPPTFSTDEQYINFVLNMAAESWANNQNLPPDE